jgi:two-component system, cell cycle response regulator DivK
MSTPPFRNAAPVLIVDDDARNVFALRAALRARGYHCTAAAGGAEALAQLSGEPRPIVVLLDMMMPDMDGYETLSRIRQNPDTAAMPVISVTAQAMLGDREKCLAAGADGYVSKPVNIDDLTALLEQYL